MAKYINERSLSIGYNNTGQEFFDILNKYRKYIHSFFFSLNCDMRGKKYDIAETIDNLKSTNTYDIPGNVLLNENMSYDTFDFFIEMAYTVCNLKAVTVLYPENAMKIREKYPDLKVHLSVRFWDWKINSTLSPTEMFMNELDMIKECIDVINISGSKSYNDHKLISLIHDHGMKTKIITNEGCIVNRSANYKHFPSYEVNDCIGLGGCKRSCDRLKNEYPWTALCTINYFKESLQFYDFDILKLSTRGIHDNSIVLGMIDYLVSDYPTNNIFIDEEKSIDITSHYDLFLDWIKLRSECSNNCTVCRKCEKIYSEMIGGSNNGRK